MATIGGQRLIRSLTLFAVLVAFWLSVSVTASTVLATTAPSAALFFWPNATALAAAADVLVQKPGVSRATLDRAWHLASASLRREPVNAIAAGTLGIVATARGEPARARAILGYAERLSRRDARVQLVLIEDRVKAGDVAGALVHYDRALRTSPKINDFLLPVLVRASTDPEIAEPLSHLLAGRPPWWSTFVGKMIPATDDPRSLALIIGRLKLDPANLGERQLLSFALERLAGFGHYAEAQSLYRQAAASNPTSTYLLRNGDFARENLLPPLEWSLVDDAGLSARQGPDAESRDSVLSLSAEEGRSGIVASQLVILPAGHFRLSGMTGNVVAAPEAARPRIVLHCAGVGGVELVAHPFDVSLNGRPFAVDFSVPAGCPAQWLTISSGRAADTTETEPWIGRLSLLPVPR